MAAETVEIPRGDVRLGGTLYLPDGAPRAAVVIHGATGAKHSYYGAFADWLSQERGFAVLTYDYSDFGASARGSMRASTATMADWGAHDPDAVQAYLRARFPDAPFWVIGHSLGGFMLPFQKNLDRVDRFIAVASGPGGWTDHPWPYRAAAMALWFGHGPISALVAGYLPGRYLGLGADLPKGVYWQWRRWCLSQDFYQGDIGSALPVRAVPTLSAPVTAIAVADDDLIPPKVAARLAALYPDASVEQRMLTPAAYGLKKIGHFGPFRRRNAVLWPAIVEDPAGEPA